MFFKATKTTTLIACLLVTLFASLSPSRAHAIPPTTICPAGWGHGSLAPEQTGIPSCGGGRANLMTFKVLQGDQDGEAVGRLDYAAPEECQSETGLYTVWVQATASNYSETFTVAGRTGSVAIFLGVKRPASGQQPLVVRISSGLCHAEAFGTFEIVPINDHL